MHTKLASEVKVEIEEIRAGLWDEDMVYGTATAGQIGVITKEVNKWRPEHNEIGRLSLGILRLSSFRTHISLSLEALFQQIRLAITQIQNRLSK